MSAVGKLLSPSSAQPWELAIAAGMSDALPVPYAQIMDPYQAPAEWLPWLAAHYSVDLWYDDWSIEHKREVIAQAAGRSVLHDGEIAALKGTRLGESRYLAWVGGQLVDAVAYPKRAIVGRYPVGRALIGNPPHKARYLVKVSLRAPRLGHCIGRHPLGRRALRQADFTAVTRAIEAVRVAKSDETEIRLDFTTARVLTAGDAVAVGDGLLVGQYLPRNRLGPR